MPTTTERPNPTGTRVRLSPPTPFDYRPGLDGVRALAVVAVLLYHVDVSWVPGGFLGVETFFVLSGYLITALLLAEANESGTIALGSFWKRRARRLLPAAYALMAGVVALALVFREELARVLGELPAALLYVYNWLPIVTQESYFEFMGRPSPLRHLWSLAIEEQFYLVWPLVVLWAVRSGGRRRLGYVALGGLILSGVTMMLVADPGIDPSRVYYGTDTRAAGLLIGALGAIIWHPSRRVGRRHRRALVVAGVMGGAGLLVAFWRVSEFGTFLYSGGFPLISLASLLLTLAAADSGGSIGRALGVAPLRWLGTRSYAIYLWHWPVVVFTRPGIDVSFDGFGVFAFRVIASLLLADISYRLVETRFRWRRSTQPESLPRLLPPVGIPRRALAAFAALLLVGAVSAVGWERPGGGSEETALALGEESTSAVTPHTPDSLAPTTSAAADPPTTVAPTTASTASTSHTTRPEPPSTTVPAPPTTAAEPGSSTTSTSVATVEASGGIGAQPELDSASFTPPTTAAPPPPPSVTAIGDSVMAGAVAQLEAAYDGPIDVDAEVGRGFDAGIAAIESRLEDDSLGDVVVVHLGNNGLVEADQVARLVEVVGSDRELVFLTVRVPRRWQEIVNTSLSDTVPPLANAELVDWYGFSEGKQEWFNADGLHIVNTPGADAYAELIVGAVDRVAG